MGCNATAAAELANREPRRSVLVPQQLAFIPRRRRPSQTHARARPPPALSPGPDASQLFSRGAAPVIESSSLRLEGFDRDIELYFVAVIPRKSIETKV